DELWKSLVVSATRLTFFFLRDVSDLVMAGVTGTSASDIEIGGNSLQRGQVERCCRAASTASSGTASGSRSRSASTEQAKAHAGGSITESRASPTFGPTPVTPIKSSNASRSSPVEKPYRAIPSSRI